LQEALAETSSNTETLHCLAEPRRSVQIAQKGLKGHSSAN